MKPATQAVAWRARNRELRNRIGSIASGAWEAVMPGSETGVESGVSTLEMIHTAPSRVSAIARLSADQARRVGHGSRCQCSKLALVARSPTLRTYWFALTGLSSAAT